MTYAEAKKNFELFGVFVHRKDRKGHWKCEEIDLNKETIPDNTEGKISVYKPYQFGFTTENRLCFISHKQEEQIPDLYYMQEEDFK